MHLEAKETARLYKLLTDKLGSDTTEAMFKYIDSKPNKQWNQPLRHWQRRKTLQKLNMILAGRSVIRLSGCLSSGSGRLALHWVFFSYS